MFWVICKSMKNKGIEDCGHRWIAFPATQETLKDVIEIAKMGNGKVLVTKEISSANDKVSGGQGWCGRIGREEAGV